MFIYKENKAQKERLDKILKRVKIIYGEVPPQMEFLGNIDVEYLEDFLKMVMRVMRHPNIDPDCFGFLRLHIAFKEGYAYCKAYNTKFLLAKGYSQEQLDMAVDDVMKVPFDEKHQALAGHALRSIYKSREVTREEFEKLYAMGWSQKDVFDATAHAGDLFRNGRILTAYSEK